MPSKIRGIFRPLREKQIHNSQLFPLFLRSGCLARIPLLDEDNEPQDSDDSDQKGKFEGLLERRRIGDYAHDVGCDSPYGERH